MQIILMLALLTASYTDIKERRIPLWLFPLVLAVSIVTSIYNGQEIPIWNWIGMAVMSFSFLILGLYGKMGGGDIIMFSVLGFTLGQKIIPFAVCMATIGTVFLICTGARKQEVPLAPFASISYIIFLIWRYLC